MEISAPGAPGQRLDARPRGGQDAGDAAVGGEGQGAVRDVGAHAARGQADAGQDLEAEVGGGAPAAADAVAVMAVDHGQKVLPVGIGATDEAGLGVHGEEPGRFGIDVDRQLGADGGDAGQDPEPLEQFELGLAVGTDHGRHVVEHAADELPALERLLPAVDHRQR